MIGRQLAIQYSTGDHGRHSCSSTGLLNQASYLLVAYDRLLDVYDATSNPVVAVLQRSLGRCMPAISFCCSWRSCRR